MMVSVYLDIDGHPFYVDNTINMNFLQYDPDSSKC